MKKSHTYFIIRACINQKGVLYGVDRQEGRLMQRVGGVASLCEAPGKNRQVFEKLLNTPHLYIAWLMELMCSPAGDR